MPPLNLHELTREDLRQQLVRWGFSSAHTKLLWNRLYLGLAESFAEMADLPPRLRTHLEAEATIGRPATVRETASSDGFTRKFLLGLADGHAVETVLSVTCPAPSASPAGSCRMSTACITAS